MALNPLYVTSVQLQSDFVDKDSGLPLAGGSVYFYQDTNRNNSKAVYQLSGSPPNYTYTPLMNPLVLGAGGTFVDENGNDIAVYYLPWTSDDGTGVADNYYIAVYSAANPYPMGTPQFTREGWPGVVDANASPTTERVDGFENALSNPQFAEVNFNPDIAYTITIGSGTNVIDIAPAWQLEVIASSSSTVEVSRTAIAGSSKDVTNPPYSLTIDPGANISSVILRQRLFHNPNIWSETVPATIPPTSGFLAATFSSAPTAPEIIMYYAPSTGTRQTLLSGTNGTGNWKTFSDTVQLDPGDNTDTSVAGYVDIEVVLDNSAASTFSSIQVVGLTTDPGVQIAFNQEPVNRHVDHLFHYYKPQLEYKPIPSWLVGWDFPLNPAQFEGPTVGATAIGANKSKYVWDQTIIFQSENSGVAVDRATNGGLKLTANVTCQMAIVQYLGQTEARKILSQPAAVALSGSTTLAGGVTGTITLWAMDGALPVVAGGTNDSIVLTLDANGRPDTRNGTWTEIARTNLNDARFTLSSTDTEVMFGGFDITTNAIVNTATFFAIVIGFAEVTATDSITMNWVGLNSGDIATRPAPLTVDETIKQCGIFYEKSYTNTEYALDTTTTNQLVFAMGTTFPYLDAGDYYSIALRTGFTIPFKSIKRTTAPDVTLYSPATGTAARVNLQKTGSANSAEDVVSSGWTQVKGDKFVNYTQPSTTFGTQFLTISSGAVNQGTASIAFHYVADARLGVVV